jgi:hypothetical protein
MAEQLQLPMLTYYEGPRLIDMELVLACRSYREAVRAVLGLAHAPQPHARALAEARACTHRTCPTT